MKTSQCSGLCGLSCSSYQDALMVFGQLDIDLDAVALENVNDSQWSAAKELLSQGYTIGYCCHSENAPAIALQCAEQVNLSLVAEYDSRDEVVFLTMRKSSQKRSKKKRAKRKAVSST